MAAPKRTLPPKLKEVVTTKTNVDWYCRNCKNGGEVKNYMIYCNILKHYCHSIPNCVSFKSK